MCYGHIHFLMLTLGTTRDKKLSSESVHNCPSNIKTRNMSHATHNLRAQRNCELIAGVPGEKPKVTSDKLPDSHSKFPCIQL